MPPQYDAFGRPVAPGDGSSPVPTGRPASPLVEPPQPRVPSTPTWRWPYLLATLIVGIAGTAFTLSTATGIVAIWIGVVAFGTPAVLSLFALLVSGSGVADPSATEAAAGAGVGFVDPRPPAARSRAASSRRSGSTTKPRAAQMVALHALLLHGLTSGQLATADQTGPIAPDRLSDVRTLLDLHHRGVIDDDALRDALAALRAT